MKLYKKRLIVTGLVFIGLSAPFGFLAYRNEMFFIPFGVLFAIGVKRLLFAWLRF